MDDIVFSEADMKVKKELDSPSPLAADGIYEPDSDSDSSLCDTILVDRDDANDTTTLCPCVATSSRRDVTRSPSRDTICEVIAADDSPTENKVVPVVEIREVVGPVARVVVGCEFQATTIQLDLDYGHFSALSATQLVMQVKLLPADAKKNIPGLPMPRYGKLADFNEPSSMLRLWGEPLFSSGLSTTEVGRHGNPVLRFLFFPHAMRVPVDGQFHLSYLVSFPDSRGWDGYAHAFSRMFSACQSTEYTPDEMKVLNQQQHEGNLRLRQVGDHVVIDLLRY